MKKNGNLFGSLLSLYYLCSVLKKNLLNKPIHYEETIYAYSAHVSSVCKCCREPSVND